MKITSPTNGIAKISLYQASEIGPNVVKAYVVFVRMPKVPHRHPAP